MGRHWLGPSASNSAALESGFLRVFTGFYRVLLGFIGFFMGFIGFHWVLCNAIRRNCVEKESTLHWLRLQMELGFT